MAAPPRHGLLVLLLFACGGPSSGDPAQVGEIEDEPVAAAKPVAAPEPPATPRLYVGDETRLAALGSLIGLDPIERVLYAPGDFEPLPAPAPGRWLAEHPEVGQSYAQFVELGFHRPDERRRALAIMPLAYPGSPTDLPIADLLAVASAFFGIPARATNAVAIDELGAISRRDRATGPQLLAPDILDALRRRLPDDAFLLVAITGVDLYPDPSWNFVFGQATLRERVAVYSTARYNPAFYGSNASGAEVASIIQRRTLKLMIHEVGHTFGLQHCVYYRCVMNGSNGIAETDDSPLHLCPVCLRKLRRSTGLDLAGRYRRLARVYRRFGLAEEAEWIEARLARLER
jgi:archaemetzincin